MSSGNDFFQKLQDSFQQARAVVGARLYEADFLFAGRPVHFSIAGSDLAHHLARPFEHLSADAPGEHAHPFSIALWDEAETGVRVTDFLEQVSWEHRWEAMGGWFMAAEGGRILAYQFERSFMAMDRATQCLLGCRQGAGNFSRYERSKPLLVLLSVWYHDQQVQMVHAGLVAREGIGILFPGKGATGKSTSALCCLNAGYDYLGDDFIGLEILNDGVCMGHSIYSTACLESNHMKRFPTLASFAEPNRFPVEDKSTLFLNQVHPHNMDRSVPIRALAMPRIVNSNHTRLVPARPAEALLRLAPSSMLFVIPRPGPEALQRMARLAERVPAYWLELGRDLAEIPLRIDELRALMTKA